MAALPVGVLATIAIITVCIPIIVKVISAKKEVAMKIIDNRQKNKERKSREKKEAEASKKKEAAAKQKKEITRKGK